MRHSTLLLAALLATMPSVSRADNEMSARHAARPVLSFVEMQSPNLAYNPLKTPPVEYKGLLTLKGKLSLPAAERGSQRRFPAVVILHGSSGVDSRGDFHAEALNAAGIATLQIDMWEARGVVGLTNRPQVPIITYPDTFSALRYLASRPDIDPQRIGVLGFSWGGVMAMASATENVAANFGGTLRFKAHAANYPVCFGYNNPNVPNSEFGRHANNPLTGAPILIQIGDKDDYDIGVGPCQKLRASLIPEERQKVEVVTYRDPVHGVCHAWDRLQIPVKAYDPFGHLGADRYDASARVDIQPNVEKAYESRDRIVRFFKHRL
ncbi:dienelactone hydrolase family protein [Niveibacterium terrae]|uniref:dienelactone hydrolase family protein n=1 Tax=Niveibacterium terrae TaxID=3373598 RepID=UPI003A93D80E